MSFEFKTSWLNKQQEHIKKKNKKRIKQENMEMREKQYRDL
jgi:hypothetical protein